MSHVTRIKVRGYHLDFYGHVNNARYLELLEEARWRMLEGAASLKDWQARGLGLVVVRIEIDYRRPATLDDELEIVSDVARVGGRSGTVRQVVTRVGDGERIAEAMVTFVVVDTRTGKAMALEGELLEALKAGVE